MGTVSSAFVRGRESDTVRSGGERGRKSASKKKEELKEGESLLPSKGQKREIRPPDKRSLPNGIPPWFTFGDAGEGISLHTWLLEHNNEKSFPYKQHCLIRNFNFNKDD